VVTDDSASRVKHPLEAQLVAAAEAGREVTIAELGGPETILAAVPDLAASRMMPGLLSALLRNWAEASSGHETVVAQAVTDLLEGATTDFVVMEAVDLLETFRPLPAALDDRCFSIFLAKAARTNPDVNGLARGAALDGAFRWAAVNRRRQLRLLDFLLGVSPLDDRDFVCRAAKISGVAYSHWRERELLSKLTEYATTGPTAGDACFELGMAYLADGLDATSEQAARALLNDAKTWFAQAASARESNPEARLYQDCLETLTEFATGPNKARLKEVLDRVRSHAFELKAWWQNDNSPRWLGARHTEAACWNLLANTIAGLTEHLDEMAWWEPSVVIEQYVLATYTAGRSIFRRRADGSLAFLLRPPLTATIAREQGQAHLLKSWLKRNLDHEWAHEARELIEEVDRVVARGKGQVDPSEAAAPGLRVAALIDQARLPETVKTSLGAAICNAFALQLSNLTQAEVDVVETCRAAVEKHPDHQSNPHGQALFDTVLLWTVRFVHNRLEVTQNDDPTVAYLFERANGSLPREDELQADYYRWLTTAAAGTDLEPTNVGGGRADIRLKSSGERLVIEVKRELVDASFGALATSYAAQSTDYQNVSIRIGFMLVMDLVEPKLEGTPHLTTLFETHEVLRAGEKPC